MDYVVIDADFVLTVIKFVICHYINNFAIDAAFELKLISFFLFLLLCFLNLIIFTLQNIDMFAAFVSLTFLQTDRICY